MVEVQRKIRIANSMYHLEHMVLWVFADEKGFLKEEGLTDYELVMGGLVSALEEREKLFNEMRKKKIDIVIDAKPSSLFKLNSQGADLYIIAAWRNQATCHLFGAKNIKTVQDLKGKRIALRDRGSITETVTSVFLRRGGLNPEKDTVWIRGKHVSGESAKALRNGEVEGAVVNVLDGPSLKEEGYTHLANLADYYPHGRPERVVVATGEMIKNYPEKIKAFLRATIRTYLHFRDKPDLEHIADVEQRLRKRSNNPEEKHLSKFNSLEKLKSTPLPLDGMPSIKGLEMMLEEEKQAGFIQGSYELKNLLYLDLVKEAFQELSKRKEIQAQLKRLQKVVQKYGY